MADSAKVTNTGAVRGALPEGLPGRLRGIVGTNAVITDPGRLRAYETDALTYIRGRPEAVLLPRSRGELVEVIRTLAAAGVPFVPRGSGTGITGGATGEGAVVVSLARLDRTLELSGAGRLARVEAGVITADISRRAAPLGLRYLPDPSSATACSIGGNVAQNSGGPHCLKHGVTADHVLALDWILPDGSTLRVARGEDGGLDLAALLIGSEGTLGIAATATVRLEPLAPTARTALALFDSVSRAGEAVSSILARSTPVALEMMDGPAIELLEASRFAAGLPREAGALLVIEVEGETEEAEEEIGRVAELAREGGASSVRIATDETERARLWAARKNGYGAMGRAAPELLVQDTVVPRTQLAPVLERLSEVAAAHDLRLVNFFHAGDGNLHPNLLFDPADPDEVRRVRAAAERMLVICVEAGGTITGEHGIGLDKREAMELVFGPGELRALRAIREAFDPRGLANPGKVLGPGEAAAVPEAVGANGAAGTGSVASGGGETWPATPRSVDELARMIPGSPGFITGGGRPGGRADAPAIQLSAPAFAGIEARDPADLVAVVGAGTRLGDLRSALAAEGQWFPPAELAADRSVGGWVAAAPWSALDVGFGDARRHVLAVDTVSWHGERLSWGRPVFKDVAGYDVKRLWCGSFGRLGALYRVALRVWPLPERRAWLRLRGPGLLRTLVDRETTEVHVDAMMWMDEPEHGPSARIGLFGTDASVRLRAERVEEWCARVGLRLTHDRDPGSRNPAGADEIRLRVTTPRDRLADRLEHLRSALGADGCGGAEGSPTRWMADPARGVIELTCRLPPAGDLALARTSAILFGAGDAAVSILAGPPGVHARAEARRAAAGRELERRIVGALGGRARDWRADYG